MTPCDRAHPLPACEDPRCWMRDPWAAGAQAGLAAFHRFGEVHAQLSGRPAHPSDVVSGALVGLGIAVAVGIITDAKNKPRRRVAAPRKPRQLPAAKPKTKAKAKAKPRGRK